MRIEGLAAYAERFTLPSLGHRQVYGDMIPGGEGMIRPMTTNEEKYVVSGYTNENMRRVLKQVVVEPEGFDPWKLIIADLLYLTFKTRMVSFGSSYRLDLECPQRNCGYVNNGVLIDLDSLDVDYLDEDFEQPIEIGPLPFEQMRKGDEVYVELNPLLSVDMIERVSDKARKIAEKTSSPQREAEYLFRLAAHIKSVGSNEFKGLDDAYAYVSKMPSMNSAYIWEHVNRVMNFGMEDTWLHRCTNCGVESRYMIPITSEFFRPSFFNNDKQEQGDVGGSQAEGEVAGAGDSRQRVISEFTGEDE